MSELIHDRRRRQDLLKHMILQLHAGEAPDSVKHQLVQLLGRIPYDDVVAVEQELIAEGTPVEEILKLCDIHHQAMKGALDSGSQSELPQGPPGRVVREENRAREWETGLIAKILGQVAGLPADEAPGDLLGELRMRFNSLMDVEKHYLRKEHLLFPYLEKKGITGPPTVMWGKHDEARALLKGAAEVLATAAADGVTAGDLTAALEMTLKPALEAVTGMVDKEEQILLPMCLDALTEAQSIEGWVRSENAPAILFWIGHSYDQLGERNAAMGAFRRIPIQYPRSAFADRASRRLRELRTRVPQEK